MILVIDVTAKFRAFFITFGTVQQTFRFPVPPAAMLFAEQVQSQLRLDQRGVKIACKLEVGP